MAVGWKRARYYTPERVRHLRKAEYDTFIKDACFSMWALLCRDRVTWQSIEAKELAMREAANDNEMCKVSISPFSGGGTHGARDRNVWEGGKGGAKAEGEGGKGHGAHRNKEMRQVHAAAEYHRNKEMRQVHAAAEPPPRRGGNHRHAH